MTTLTFTIAQFFLIRMMVFSTICFLIAFVMHDLFNITWDWLEYAAATVLILLVICTILLIGTYL